MVLGRKIKHLFSFRYRMTQERLREFRNLRNEGRQEDMSGFMTLEQFMLSRQEEQRNLRVNRNARTRGKLRCYEVRYNENHIQMHRPSALHCLPIK